ncbi:MAG: tRNA cyclic N6-threonylcarbamoyladenosine(37) synthase TcdA [Chromatiales bacterium]|jgi:tRNA A37 threonylcarbamoyladenosine dehydratase
MTGPESNISARRFGGIARLYGNSALQRFSQASVCVIGVGGVGSWAVEALARSGIGRLQLIDMDHVAESNINRQLPALESTLGQSKIGALAERIAQINPDCRVELIDDFISADNLDDYLAPAPDFVLDCIDSFRTKAALISYCKRHKIALVTTGGAGGQIDPGRIRLTDLARSQQDPLLAKTRSQLRQQYGFSRNLKKTFGVPCVWSDEPISAPAATDDSCDLQSAVANSSLNCGGLGSSMAVTASFGLFAASHVLNKLAAST